MNIFVPPPYRKTLFNLSRRTVYLRCPERARNEGSTGPKALRTGLDAITEGTASAAGKGIAEDGEYFYDPERANKVRSASERRGNNMDFYLKANAGIWS